VQYRYQVRSEYRVFTPYPICETTFKTDSIRLEMDTRTVTDWNELDYISMVVSSRLISGVLPAGTRELVYVPNPDAEGRDTFEYAVSDCPFQPRRFSNTSHIGVYIVPSNDPPVATNWTIYDLEEVAGPNSDGTGFELRSLVHDVDVNDSLTFSVKVVGDPGVRARISNISFLVLDVLWGTRLSSHFDVEFTATDSAMAKATGYILYRPRFSSDIAVAASGLSALAVAGVAIGGTLFAFGGLLGCYCCVKLFHKQCLRAIIPGTPSSILFLSPRNLSRKQP
jgi:hypothetical protein